jgi:hypothetical protein
MVISRRDFFKQFPDHPTLRTLGGLLGSFLGTESEQQGSLEEAGLALGRTDSVKAPSNSAGDADAGESGAYRKSGVKSPNTDV